MNKYIGIRFVCACSIFMSVAYGVTGAESSQAPLSHSQQLARLRPENLEAYFTLGETIGATAKNTQESQIARQVLAVGIGLATRQDNPQLAASMCIALASLELHPEMSTELWDFALMLDHQRLGAWRSHRDSRHNEQAEIRKDAAMCVYAARFNNHKLASELWGRAQVRKMIKETALQAGFSATRFEMLISEMIQDAKDDQCRGRVFITERNDGKMQRIICADHARPLGAALDDQSLRQLITVERLLLDIKTTSANLGAWEVNEYLQITAPSRDPSFASIRDYYQINLSKPYWQGGGWASSP